MPDQQDTDTAAEVVAGDTGRPDATTADHPDGEGQADVTRRVFAGRVGRTVVVMAPIVLLFRPTPAYAGSGGSGTS